ncbi:muconate/chloromuconate family cycloisomerase [Flavobacterium sp. NKUCC04_CG]|uniref:muconate/chloromuconate family cycloisomerase n=1 Tax=Flavobacterium sp. NKUCC04_CG TaxID=2842121 RepID=UPI001C5B77DC|nr:muconate/chloromuconate family cycloisomerase [Flavobacterium sp. NKUCC04_CG]MBW3518092.1 muconate/chloromuconate family cycloisomerase [Flavobacterium sp. NKUCC04_CG]
MSKITITHIETILVDLPTIRPHLLSMTVMQKQTMVIIRLFCSDGIEGIGESTTIGGIAYGDEFPEGMKLAIDTYFTPLLIGQDPVQINAIRLRLDKYISGNNFAKSGIETALLDAQGKRLNVPVSDLFGGAITNTLPVLWTLASGDTQRDIDEAKQLIATKRHHTFKLKIGRKKPDEDIAHVAAIKSAVGRDITVTVDVNQAWSETVAKRAIQKLQDAGIDLIEQPLAKSDFEGLARLTSYFEVPIMADEAVATVQDAFKLAKIHAVSVFALKIAKAGGLINIQKQAAIAQAAGISLYGGTMLEGTIGTLATAHLCATLPNLEWGTELFGPLLLTDDIVKTPLVYSNYALEIPNAAGLGVELDLVKIEKYKRK